MKFIPQTDGRNLEDCQAYITGAGNLVIRSTYHSNGCVWIDPTDGETDTSWEWTPDEGEVHFFPGDTLTIQF